MPELTAFGCLNSWEISCYHIAWAMGFSYNYQDATGAVNSSKQDNQDFCHSWQGSCTALTGTAKINALLIRPSMRPTRTWVSLSQAWGDSGS